MLRRLPASSGFGIGACVRIACETLLISDLGMIFPANGVREYVPSAFWAVLWDRRWLGKVREIAILHSSRGKRAASAELALALAVAFVAEEPEAFVFAVVDLRQNTGPPMAPPKLFCLKGAFV